MVDHCRPTKRQQPARIIIHCETNDLASERSARETATNIIELAKSLSTEETTVLVSGLTQRGDDLNHKVLEVNTILKTKCQQINLGYIDNNNLNPDRHLNNSKLHLNSHGSSILAKNFINAIKD